MAPVSTAWFTLLMDITVKSLLLGGLAAVTLVLLRVRNVNARHRVWTMVMLAMCCMPVLVQITPQIPLPASLTINFPATDAANPTQSAAEPYDQAAPTRAEAEATPPPSEFERPAFAEQLQFQDTLEQSSNSRGHDSASTSISPFEGLPQEIALAENDLRDPAKSEGTSWWPIGFAWMLVIVHLIGMTALLGRLAVGLYLARRIVARARPINISSSSLTHRRVELVESTQTSVPITIGILRPRVILPSGWRDWSSDKLHSVLAHEFAHVRRGDWLVAVLAELNRALHWFNPLAWYVRRQLSDLAEHNCDDAVIAASGDRATYARHLLEVATALSSQGTRFRPPRHSIAMARRPVVESRINAILDDTRPLARRLGWLGAISLLALAVPTILIAAGLQPAQSTAKTDDESAETGSDTESFVYAGQVVEPDGSPASGVELRLVYWYSDASQIPRHEPDAVTDENGNFRFKFKRNDFYRTGDSVPPWHWAALVAVKEGFGLAYASSLAFEQTGGALKDAAKRNPNRSEQQLRKLIAAEQGPLRLTADDAPITGKLIDLEGQPVPNVRVSLHRVSTGEDNTLKRWNTLAAQPNSTFDDCRSALPKQLYGPLAKTLLPTTTSNEDGQFRLAGIGRDQLVEIVFESPTISSIGVYCRTTNDETIKFKTQNKLEPAQVYGSYITHVVTPSTAVTGIVKDRATGQPIPGVRLSSMEVVHSMFTNNGIEETKAGNELSIAVTDEQGRYVLNGLPKVDGNPIRVIPPADLGYMSAMQRVDTSDSGEAPLNQDFELSRGVLVEGRVTDSTTGQGVAGKVEYLAVDSNAGTGIRLQSSTARGVEQARSDTQGHFQIVVPQGKGFISFVAFDDSYAKKSPRPKGAAAMTATAFTVASSPDQRMPEYHALADVDLDAATTKQQVDLNVFRGTELSIHVTGPNQESIDGYFCGRTEHTYWFELDQSRLNVLSYDPDVPRRVTIVSNDRKLAGTRLLAGDVESSLDIQLQPSASLIGRLVNKMGDPIEDLALFPTQAAKAKSQTGDGYAEPVIPLPTFGLLKNRILTDDEGRFRIDGLVADQTYSLIAFEHSPQGYQAPLQGRVASELTIAAGQTHDLGDVVIERMAVESELTSAEQPTNAPPQKRADESAEVDQQSGDGKKAAGRTASISGQVFNPEGGTLAGAKLYWPRLRVPVPTRLEDMYLQHVGTSDDNGRFQLELILPQNEGFGPLPVIAVAQGFGMAWQDLKMPIREQTVELRMTEEYPIRGQVLTTEGMPVEGVAIRLNSLMADSSGRLDKWLTAWNREWRSASRKVDRRLYVGGHLLGDVLGFPHTDATGRFELRGLGREQAVWLSLRSPEIAVSQGIVVSRQGFDPAPYNKAALAQAGDMSLMLRQTPKLYGDKVQILVEPSKVIRGRVTDLETGKGIKGVRVDTNIGYGDAILAETDENGEYELAGLSPQDDEVLLSFQKPNTNYLHRTLATNLTTGLAPMQFDAGLARGVILSGRVTETETGKPVSGGIRFVPLEKNEWRDKPGYDNYKRSRVMESVDNSGNFEFVCIPGPGVLLMQAYGSREITIGGKPVKPYRKGKFTKEELKSVRIHSEGKSFYTGTRGIDFFENGMKVIDVPAGTESYSTELTVDRGLEIDVAIVDEAGAPVSGCMVCGVSASWPITFTADDSTIRIYALDPEKPRRVIFYHPQRKLAGALMLGGDEPESPVARLLPTKVLVGRAVQDDGEPLANAAINFSWTDDTSREFQRQLNMSTVPHKTDDNGEFQIEGALPGMFRLSFTVDGKRFSTQKKWDDVRTIAASLIGADKAEVQLGDIAVKAR